MTYSSINFWILRRKLWFYMSAARSQSLDLFARPGATQTAPEPKELNCRIRACRRGERLVAFLTVRTFKFWFFLCAALTVTGAVSNVRAQDKSQGQTPPDTNAVTSTQGQTPPDTNALSSAQGPTAYRKMSLEELMNLDVTSVAKQPEPYKDAAASINVVTSDEIRRSGASSLPEALRLADNLDVEQASSASWDISARGFNTSGYSDKLLVLMDGRTLYSPLLAGVIWSEQDAFLPDIDRIEVISGPGGTLWGANAMNGVINIISKNAKDTQGLYAEGGGGSWLQDFGGARYGGVITSNIYYRVYGKYSGYGPEVFDNGSSAQDSWSRWMSGFRIDSEASAKNLYTLQGDIYGGNTRDAPGGEGSPVAEGTTSGGNILGRWTHTYSDESDMQLQLYYDRTHLSAPFAGDASPPVGPPIPMGTLFDDLDTADMDFQDRFPLGRHDNVVWGLGYRFTHDFVQPTPLVDFIPNTLDQNLYSAFVQDQVKLADNFSVTVGTKLEHNDFTGFEYEPSVRAQWNFTDNQMVWGAISRSVRMPSEFDRDLFEASPGYFEEIGTSNSVFRSEKVIAYELGYRAQVTKDISGSLSAFFNDYHDLRSLALNTTTLFPAYWANNDRGETWGFELTVDYQVCDWWRLHAGYDFLQENIYVVPSSLPSVYEDADGGYGNTADPENQVFLRSSMDLPHNIELDADGRWIDQAQFNNGSTLEAVPSYFELGLRLGWYITKNIEVSVVGQNLLQPQHPEAGAPGPSQEQIVRGVYGKLAVNF
jgi:iron complex outermembrane receptor protein